VDLERIVRTCLYRYRHLDFDTLDDLFQEGLIAAWQTRERYGPTTKRALLARSAENGMINWLRKFGRLIPGRSPKGSKAQRPLPTVLPIEGGVHAEPPCFDQELERLDALAHLMEYLTPIDQRILWGMGHQVPSEEIAQQIGRKCEYVRNRKKRIIQLLKKKAQGE
jgi:RNA polymerase sigma factor (sigma-70 family)